MFSSLFFLASQSTSFFIHKSIVHPFIHSIHPVLPYLGIWELACIAFSRVYLSHVSCLLRDGLSIIDTLAATFAYRLEELYWSLAFWPILLTEAMTGFPSFASDVAATILRFFLGINSCRSPDFWSQRHPESRRIVTRQAITMAPNSEKDGSGDTVPPISFNGDAQAQSTPRISLCKVSPPACTNAGSTTSSVTTSTTTQTLLPTGLNTRSQSERSTPKSGFMSSRRNKFPVFPSPPTISSPSPTLRSSSAVYSSTSTHKTVLISLPVGNVGSSSSRIGAIIGSVSSPSSMYSSNTTLSSTSPCPQSPVMGSSSSSTTPVSSPHSSMLKFSTPPSPLRSKSKAKRIQSRKRTPATPRLCPISPIRRSPTPYPARANSSRASDSLMRITVPSTPTTPKAKTRSMVKTAVVTTPTPKSKSHQQQQQQQVGKGNRSGSKRGNTRGNGAGNVNVNETKAVNGGGIRPESRSERYRHLA